MKYARVDKRDGEKLRGFLVKHNLFCSGYPPKSDRNCVAFPITDGARVKAGFPRAVITELMAKKVEKPSLQTILKGKLTPEQIEAIGAGFDTVGDIAIIEIPEGLEKKGAVIGQAVLQLHKNLRTVVSKASMHEGEFRLQRYRHLAGKRTLETVHKENGVLLKLDIAKVYFSTRSATERLRVARQVKPGEMVLVMFAGCGPFVCTIAKNSKAGLVVGVELNPDAHRYAVINKNINKLSNVELYEGDVRKVVPQLKQKFHRILMPLPKTGGTFLDVALSAALPKGVIHFYDFQNERDFPKATIEKVKRAIGKTPKVIGAVVCGSYSPALNRVCLDFQV